VIFLVFLGVGVLVIVVIVGHWHTSRPLLERLFEKSIKRKPSKAFLETKREGRDWLPIYFKKNRAPETGTKT
jgi:hypothetical protein